MTSNDLFILGVSGGSAAGKTTVAHLLADSLEKYDPAVISVDAYFSDQSSLTEDQLDKFDFDSPDALDFDLLARHLAKLKSGEQVTIPEYNYATHSSRPDGVTISPSRLIIVEGILLFYPKSIQGMLDCKIFVDADADERLRRRVARDVKERGRTSESVTERFKETVEPGFEKYTLPTRPDSQFTLSWNQWDFKALEVLSRRVEALIV
jgi:uridine kinase